MDWTWAVRGLVGGALIGISASLLFVMNGRIAGISGILGSMLGMPGGSELAWRGLFVLGLLLGGAAALVFVPDAFGGAAPSLGIAIAAGALVGVGTKLGSGCTSGHGVCGLSRLSARSLVATLTFISTGALAVLAARWVGVSW